MQDGSAISRTKCFAGIAGVGWQGRGNGEAPGELWNPAIAPHIAYAQQLRMRQQSLANAVAVYPSADSINRQLQELFLRAEARGGSSRKQLARLHETVTALQDTVLRDPLSRETVAGRLALMSSVMRRSQKLQDADSVYLAPYVDDLDNYLQVCVCVFCLSL
jgi:hypothetical protein